MLHVLANVKSDILIYLFFFCCIIYNYYVKTTEQVTYV